MDLVGQLKLTSQVGDISDVSALQALDGGWYAYLGDGGECQTGGAIDNEELEDVDLFEITDPTSPVLLAETELPDVHLNGSGHNKTSHDFGNSEPLADAACSTWRHTRK